MPAPPPKENAWVKRNTAPPPNRSLSSESSQSGGDRHNSERQQSGQRGGDENKEDGLEHESKTGGRNAGERGRTSDRKEKDSELSKEERAAKFSQASKYAALCVDGEDEAEEYAD
ncbi:hypothetical protein GDO81_021747 [Engystomops pustulosus]|uniref:Uncharacterized protein n=2 Tax=Engystomops pustulosus TaxID=76066 RepID=A0AAV6YVH8_ENGPU|nr:hypothetical protein GDO81_021747 [Engystomops pustulosus]